MKINLTLYPERIVYGPRIVVPEEIANMPTERIELTKEQCKAMGEEYQKLFDLAIEQLNEHRMWLGLQLAAITPEEWQQLAGDAPFEHMKWSAVLQSEVNEITIASIRVEDGMREMMADGKVLPTISAVYEYPDMLYAFLRKPDAPEALRKSLFGGMPLDEEQSIAAGVTRL